METNLINVNKMLLSDFNYICRVCLKKNENLRPFLELNEEIIEIFQNATQLEMNKNDQLPKNMCSNCVLKLKFMCLFVLQCRESDLTLKCLIVDFDHNYNNRRKEIVSRNLIEEEICISDSDESITNIEDSNSASDVCEILDSDSDSINNKNTNEINKTTDNINIEINFDCVNNQIQEIFNLEDTEKINAANDENKFIENKTDENKLNENKTDTNQLNDSENNQTNKGETENNTISDSTEKPNEISCDFETQIKSTRVNKKQDLPEKNDPNKNKTYSKKETKNNTKNKLQIIKITPSNIIDERCFNRKTQEIKTNKEKNTNTTKNKIDSPSCDVSDVFNNLFKCGTILKNIKETKSAVKTNKNYVNVSDGGSTSKKKNIESSLENPEINSNSKKREVNFKKKIDLEYMSPKRAKYMTTLCDLDDKIKKGFDES